MFYSFQGGCRPTTPTMIMSSVGNFCSQLSAIRVGESEIVLFKAISWRDCMIFMEMGGYRMVLRLLCRVFEGGM